MTITEPMTLLTDYLLAALVFYFAFRLFRAAGRSGQLSVRWWAAAFVFSGLAGVTGGTYHGFRTQLGAAVGLWLWKITVYAIGIAGLSLMFGAALSSLRRSFRLWVFAAALLEFLVYAVWMVKHNDFRFVIYDYGPVLLVVLLLQFLRLGREKSAPWILGGILLSFGAAGVQASGFDPAPGFNHNDLYHIVQMGAFYLLYRGGSVLRDRANSS